ncbi:MAG: sigma-54-dependent transcriptional regulator [Verrucomicrobiota bacterium]
MKQEKPTLLIVDDEKPTRDGLRRAMENHFEVYLAESVEGALNVLDVESIDVVLTDLRMPGGDDGMKLLEKCQGLSKPPVCVMMTAYGAVDTAVQAMRRGAYDYVTKPLNIDKLEMLLLRAVKSKNTEQENKNLREELDKKFGLENLIGSSPRMMEIFDVIRQVADSRATVLIEGESGTGKELVAKAIHQLSPRKNKAFVAVHCAALSPQLLESELFGHEKGAFTGAMERRIGRFEQADKGTIFLDEIGEIDASVQVKLLRVLGERKFERVGGNQQIEVDARLIAATNKNLETMVKEEKFREDLFYRIHVVKISMPPLRERREDIPLLTQAFLKEFCKENGKPSMTLEPQVEKIFLNYDWPGNVRELRTAVEHGVVLSKGEIVALKDLPPALRGFDGHGKAAWSDTFKLDDVEKNLIFRALEKSNNNRTDAAKLLGISRRTLHRKLNEYGVKD